MASLSLRATLALGLGAVAGAAALACEDTAGPAQAANRPAISADVALLPATDGAFIGNLDHGIKIMTHPQRPVKVVSANVYIDGSFESPWKPLSERRADGGEAPQTSAPAPAARHHDYDSIEDLRTAVDAHERAILIHHLGRNRWNQRQTAKALGLTYDQLRHCIRKHGLADSDAA